MIDLLDQIYAEFGYFEEKNGSLVFEGAEGADKIERLVRVLRRHEPSAEMLRQQSHPASPISRTETIRDIEGDEIPKEKMSIFDLEDHTRIAVRASGTEPKIKYYLLLGSVPSPVPSTRVPWRKSKTGYRPARAALDLDPGRRPSSPRILFRERMTTAL